MNHRIVYRRTHLVLSLVAGLWLAASGLAGSLLVFGDALDPLLHAELYRTRSTGRRVSIDEVIAAAERATGGVATRLRLAGRGTPVHEVWIDCDDCRRVWVDPASGVVNGVRSAHGTTRLFLHEFHRRMLLRGAGDAGALAGGVILLLLAGTGLVLGWRGGVRVRKASIYEWHRVTGLVLSPFLLIAGATGVYFIQAGLRAAPTPAKERVATRIEPLLERGRRAFPEAEATWLSLTGPQITVRLRQPEEDHPNGRTFVRFDAARGTVAGSHDALTADRRTRFLDNLYPLHIGATGGIAHKFVLVLAGLSPSFLLGTGLVLSMRRWRRARRSNRPAEGGHSDRYRPAA